MANEFLLVRRGLGKDRTAYQPGAWRVDDGRVSSEIIHVLKSSCRGQDCPRTYGHPTTIYTGSTAGAGGGSGNGYLTNLSRSQVFQMNCVWIPPRFARTVWRTMERG